MAPDMDYVFNFRALLVGCAAMLICLLLQATAAHAVSLQFKPKIEALQAHRKHYRAQLIFLASALLLLASHLCQIYVWGGALWLSGAEENRHIALVFAGSTYTTVGFANDPLPVDWQLTTIIMATSGLFSFGWSTSIMFLLAQTLYPSQR